MSRNLCARLAALCRRWPLPRRILRAWTDADGNHWWGARGGAAYGTSPWGGLFERNP